MTLLASWRSFARAVFLRSRFEREMDQELEFHIEARADHLEATGLDRPRALRQAQRELGDPLRWKEQGREARGLRLVDQLRNDVRYGLRWLRRSPAFAAAAVLSIAIGIGANTAIFSLVNAVLLKLMPVDHPESLVILSRSDDSSGLASSFSYPFFRELRDSGALDSAIAITSFEPNVEIRGAAERVSGEMVSGEYFEVLGIRPYRGRLFTADDNRIPGGHPLVVLSHDYWQRRFGGDPNVIGTTLLVNMRPMTIVGITPPQFAGVQIGASVDIRVPMVMQTDMLLSPSRLDNPAEWWLLIVGRSTSNRAVLQQRIDAIYQRSLARIPNGLAQDRHVIVRDGSRGQPLLQNRFAKPLTVLSALALGVLLLVCLNVANLTLARTVARRRELAVRIVLGATRGRIVGQLLIETLLIGVTGGALGVVLSQWAAQGLASIAVPATTNALLNVTLDWRVLSFALGLSIAAGFLCGIWPSLVAQDTTPAVALSAEGRAVATGRLFTRRLLVTLQIALSFALLVGAGLFARTLVNLRTLDFGFETEHLLSARLDATLSGYTKPQLMNFIADVCQRVTALPGVRSVSFGAIQLLNRSNWGSGITLDTGVQDDRPGPDRNAVGPRYFSTIGVPVLAGREFAEADSATSSKVAIVNEAFARKYFDGQAIGRRIGPGGSNGAADYTIVGVVRNGKYAEVRENIAPFWYVPYPQLESLGQSDTAVRISRGLVTLHVRTVGDPSAAIQGVRAAIAEVDKRAIVFGISTMDQQITDQLRLERLLAWLGAAFAVIALVLAALGLYGVVAYDTTARTRELGLRIALGETQAGIVLMILRQTALLVMVGLAGGEMLVLAGVGYVRSLLFGLQPTDPVVLFVTSAIIVAVTALASMLPARRAARIEPAVALQ